MRSQFNSEPNYKHLSYPSHTISLLLQVSLLVCASQCLVCLLVAFAMRQTYKLPQTASPQNNEQLLCFVFSGADPMTSPYWAREEWKQLRFCLCSPLWGICRGAVEGLGSGAHRRGTQPELSESRGAQENTGPPKQNTFYGNGYIYLHGSQKDHGRMAF